MKKITLLFVFAFIYLALSSQTFTESYVNGYKILKGQRPEINVRDCPVDAYEQGRIKIKIDRSFEMQLPDVTYQASSERFVRTGISGLDNLNEQFQATTYIPLFGVLYETQSRCSDFRESHRAWGFHLWFTIELDENVSIADAVEAYQALPFVEIAEPFYKTVLYDGDPVTEWFSDDPPSDDPQLANQWHYNNEGQAGGTPGCDISLFDAWTLEKGNSEVIVSVVDCGINQNHPDLQANMWDQIGYNFFQNTPNINPGDHGCHTGGTISAVTNNGVGVAGIVGGSGSGDGVRLMTCQVYNPAGNNGGGFYNAYVYAADNGACISQNSWGYVNPNVFDQVVLDGIDYFIANGGGDVMTEGIVIFAAGNNSSSGNYYPGYYPPCLAVAATNNKDQKAGYSNYGTWVNISAPGGVTNYNPSNPAGVLSCTINGYAYYEGTSMACPHVSGVAALLVSYASRFGIKLSRQEVWNLLVDNVDNHYPVNPSYTGLLGSGRLNASKAINALLICGGPVSNLEYTLNYDKIVNLTWSRPANDEKLIGYIIYINGVEVEGMLTEESFTYQALVEDDYEFCVVAVHENDDGECHSSLVCKNVQVTSICDPVTDLSATIDGNTVSLSWSAPELISEVLHYNIYRNNEFVEAVETESFSEEINGGNHDYSVETEYLNECISDKVSIGIRVLDAPTNVTATPQDEIIVVFWDYEEDITFNVYRDENLVASNIAQKNYNDPDVIQDINYCYYIKATLDEIESAASEEACAIIIGIDEYNSKLKVYPNPATKELTIENGQLTIDNVEIFDIYGRKLLSHTADHKPHITIDVSNFAAGNYVFSVYYSDGSIDNVKVVIK